jgi:hypothetical protein
MIGAQLCAALAPHRFERDNSAAKRLSADAPSFFPPTTCGKRTTKDDEWSSVVVSSSGGESSGGVEPLQVVMSFWRNVQNETSPQRATLVELVDVFCSATVPLEAAIRRATLRVTGTEEPFLLAAAISMCVGCNEKSSASRLSCAAYSRAYASLTQRHCAAQPSR